jgi:hypothetical protein
MRETSSKCARRVNYVTYVVGPGSPPEPINVHAQVCTLALQVQVAHNQPAIEHPLGMIARAVPVPAVSIFVASARHLEVVAWGRGC